MNAEDALIFKQESVGAKGASNHKFEVKLHGDNEEEAQLDLYKIFELTLPFSELQLTEFIERVQMIDSKAGNCGFVTKEELLQSMSELNKLDRGSDGLRRLLPRLMSKTNRDTDCPDIDIQSLMIFGLLHCKSKPDE